MESNESLLGELEQINRAMLEAEEQQCEAIDQVKANHRASAINLIDYLALRSQNIEVLQSRLHHLGLSSLASSESHIKSQIRSVIQWLADKSQKSCEVDSKSGVKQLKQNVNALLGTTDSAQTIPVMVTFDTAFADDLQLLC